MAEAAARTPQALAVAGPCGAVTYAQLDARADALAGVMAGYGVGRGDRVLVWSPKSPDALAAMQAVLRLGAAYVPIDPLSPVERVATIARESSARALCAPADLLSRVPGALRELLVCVDTAPPEGADAAPDGAGPREAVSVLVDQDEPAYILFTSGSTGTPKGVSVSHRNALAFVAWAVEELSAGPGDRFANHASFSFDLSVLDIYAAFAVGAAVCPVPTEFAYAPGRLVEFLHRERITVWYSVPSVLILMQRDGGLLDRPAPGSLRALLFAGEPFPIHHVRLFAEWTDARLLNLYGPTETNVCTRHEVQPEDLERDLPVPIGTACSGDRVWASKPDGRAAGPGEEGELMVSGPTVFLGYWGRPAQNGPYATGDRVRVRPDGSFDYLGRADGQVKVRGHRIELSEVTAALHTHPEVAEAAVAAVGDGLDRRLAAFVARTPASVLGNIALRRHLARLLPPQMIPDDVRFVDELPRNHRGKLDLAALVSAHDT
ncbi:amino acid adenylation domain-containing protein [Streptomyces broussonetiae]|uniref:Amino acid adenylation domain-containing protein n=1 Tax=Streptomyces broussonetiae TaxID=2686304 RepID=A0A6I6NNA7_9ACTN|nr:amino acid adenylation domain-containing protein [Streptomyces broussonetiae]QHA09467.1 amino acid adenylation domain-containing protein [Streptomyces broussonetiae]